jgi:Flp pilus assembly secretin CpaC
MPPANRAALELRLGDTVRQRMNRTIDKIHVKEPRVAEVTLDPTDAKRVIIKALNAGGTQIELTDDAGAKETYSLRIR